MGNISARQVVKTRSTIYHDPYIRQALQQRRFATALGWWAAHKTNSRRLPQAVDAPRLVYSSLVDCRTAQKKAQAPNPQLRVALQQRYGEVGTVKVPQDSGKVRQLVASTGAVYRAPSCDPWSRGQLFR